MKNLLLSKNLLSKSLSKSLSKLLLLVLLTFSGCEMIRSGFNQTVVIPSSDGDSCDETMPSAALVDLIGGETLMVEEYKDGVYKIATMKVNSNATAVSIFSDYKVSFDRTSSYDYTDGGENWATYEGTDNNLGAVRFELKNIKSGKYYPTVNVIVYANEEVYIEGTL